MKIKVCGLRNYENISNILIAGADYVGFIFHKESPRYFNGSLSFDEVRSIKAKKVGVFVNECTYSILDKVAHHDLDLVQLHGNESPQQCKELKSYVKVIKTFGMDPEFNFEILKEYVGSIDYFLFDTKTEFHGGSGKSFDHKLLSGYNLETPFFISGGISSESTEALKKLKMKQLFGIDINSKFEISPGMKEASKVKQFINELK